MRLHNLAFVGAGSRGRHMARLTARNSERARIVAVVEPDKTTQIQFQREFNLPDESCFENYKNLLESKVKLDGVFVATTPDTHAEITCAFLRAGIPVFLEKPMATTLEDATRIFRVAKKTSTPIQVGFNCRYVPFFERIKEIASSGELGQILSLEWKEILNPYHWSTYCRYPSYRNRRVIGSWLLEKCCHDLDLMNWITGELCLRVASFGSRSYFNRRDDLPQYCTDSCPVEERCIFSSIKFYPELKEPNNRLLKYHSLCVYNADSDLVDHQSSILEYHWSCKV